LHPPCSVTNLRPPVFGVVPLLSCSFPLTRFFPLQSSFSHQVFFLTCALQGGFFSSPPWCSFVRVSLLLVFLLFLSSGLASPPPNNNNLEAFSLPFFFSTHVPCSYNTPLFLESTCVFELVTIFSLPPPRLYPTASSPATKFLEYLFMNPLPFCPQLLRFL